MHKKRSIIFLSILFFISLFVFFTNSIVDARAGGGQKFNSGSSSSKSSSSSVSSSSSNSSSSSWGSSSSKSSSSYHKKKNNSSSEGSSDFFVDIFNYYYNKSTLELIFYLIGHLIFAFYVVKISYCNGEPDTNTFIFITVISSPLMVITWFFAIILVCYSVIKEKYNNANNYDYNFKEIENYSSIKSKDPLFNKEKFLERVKKAFVIVQESWSNRDLSKAEAFLADGTYEQFQIQINAMKANHEIDLMKDINIKKAIVVRLSSKSGYDSLNVLFTVKAVNYRIDDRNNSFKNGSKKAEEFSEIWTFMRRTGSKTIKNGLIEGYCPNCGAKVEGARLSKCPSCSSLLRSGQHDWILAGITQASEWRDSNRTNPIAYNSILNKDKLINIPHLEDKLTMIFWRMVEANRIGNAEPILKVSTNEFAESYANLNYSSIFPKCKECALGSQEVIGFVTNRSDYDYLIGQLVWSGISISDNKEVFSKSMFVLRRKKDVKSDPGKCFCSTHCPNCGAAEPSDLSSNTCEYCNSPFNDDSKDWILTDILKDFSSKEAIKYMLDANKSAKGQEISKTNSLQQKNYSKAGNADSNAFDYISGNDLLSLTVAMMLADGVIDNREMNIINNIRNARKISYVELTKIIDRMKNLPDPIGFVLNKTAIKLDENLIKLLITIAAADNRIEDSELKVLQKVAGKMNISEKRLRDLINEVYEKNWNKA